MSTPFHTHLVDGSLEDVDQAQQEGVHAEEDVVGADGVDSLWVLLQKLPLPGGKSATHQLGEKAEGFVHHDNTRVNLSRRPELLRAEIG